MESETLEPINYCGASYGHVIASQFSLKEGEPLKLFGREDNDDSIFWLDLSNCTGVIDGLTFSLLPGLKHLYIDNCKFDKWKPGVFSSLQLLNSLNMTNSKFTINGDTFENAGNLDSLSLADLEDINDNSFCNLKNLKSLTLERCKLGNITNETFAGLREVTYLRISECDITDILLDAFEVFEMLDILILSENKIGNIDFDSFSKLITVTDLSFHDNSLNCTMNHEIFKKLPNLNTILFDTQVYQDLDFEQFLALKKVNIAMPKESDTQINAIIEKLLSQNIEYGTVICGKVEVDMSEVMICG